MANRYWVGGTAAWDGTAGTKWALTSGGPGGQAVPTSADDVFFDGSSGANTVTISTGNTGAKSITCTGFTGTLAGTAAITVSGNLTLVAGMTVTYSGTITFDATATLISAGKTLGSVTVNGSGITVTLGDALTYSSSGTLTVTQGTFTTANFNVTGGSFGSSNTNTRTITLGSSTITISGTWSTNTTTNLTFNANTSQITQSGTLAFGASTARFLGGGLTFYNYSHTSAAVGSNGISGANTYNNFTFGTGSGAVVKRVFFADNITVNGTFNVSGTSAVARTLVSSDVIGTARTITAAAVSATDADFRDITIAGAAAPISPTRAGDCKGNSGITFPAAKTVYWNLAGTQNWSATGWATTSTGTPAVNNFPLAQDTAVFTDSGAAGTVTIDTNYNIGTLDMSGRTSAMTLSTGTQTQTGFYGNWLNGSGVTLSGTTNTLLFAGRVTQSVTSAGKTFTFPWDVSSPSGTVLLVDNCTLSNTVTQTQGTLDLSGKTLSVTSYITAAGTKNLTFNGGTVVVSNATTTAWNNAQPTGYTTTAGTGTGKISMTAATAKTFVGGGSTYNCTLSNDGAGALTITGSNTFTTLANGVQPTTFTFTAGTTTTATNFNVKGTAGNLVTIGSATAANHTLSQASGVVASDYLSISRSTATGGASWYAGANSTNGGNNSGWIFAAAAYSIIAAGSTFSYTGNNANLIYTSAGAYTIAADGGTYSYSGNNANTLYNRAVAADGGTYSYTGNNANTLLGRTVQADGSTYSYTGNNANLLFTYRLVAEGGIYSYTGNDASLVYTPSQIVVFDGHDGDKKRQKKWDDERERREYRKQELIKVYEQLNEVRPEVARSIVKPHLTVNMKTPTVNWDAMLRDLDRVERLMREHQEMDDEEVLLLL